MPASNPGYGVAHLQPLGCKPVRAKQTRTGLGDEAAALPDHKGWGRRRVLRVVRICVLDPCFVDHGISNRARKRTGAGTCTKVRPPVAREGRLETSDGDPLARELLVDVPDRDVLPQV